MSSSSLDDVMKYRNDDVVAKFLQRYPFSWDEGHEVFDETKRWLWFAANSDLNSNSMYRSLAVVDEMWHVFVAFTLDYHEFCDRYLGRYIHHVPTTEGQREEAKQALEEDVERVLGQRERNLRTELSEISRLLGDDTVRKWFIDFGTRFSIGRCNTVARQGLERHSAQSDMEPVELSLVLAQQDLSSFSGTQLIDEVAALTRETFKQETCMGGCGCRRCGGGGCQGCTSGVVSPKCRPR